MERNDGVIRLLRIFHWTNMLVIGIFVVWVAGSFIHTLDRGIGYAISNALVAALISLFLVAGALWLVNLTVGNLMRSLAVRKLKEQFGNYLTADFEHTWKQPPGIFAISTRNNFMIASYPETGYVPIRLTKDDIQSIKVERNVDRIETKTKHRGNLSMHGGMFGYNFGSSSRSISKVKEAAFLEIQYLTAQDEPEILVIPFGEDRITAEKAQSMLQRF